MCSKIELKLTVYVLQFLMNNEHKADMQHSKEKNTEDESKTTWLS